MAPDPRTLILSELRWWSTAYALVDRSDRVDALLRRYETVDDRLKTVEQLYSAFIAASAGVSEDVRNQVANDIDQVYEMYDTIVQRARSLVNIDRSVDKADITPTPTALLNRLPNLDLPKFDGSLETWIGYINLFDSLVDSRADLTASQKLAYMRSSLSGEAAQLVQHIAVDNEGYPIARDILFGRYQNIRCLADTHAAIILGLPKIGSTLRLRSDLLNPLLLAYNTLNKLKINLEKDSFLLLHIVLTKLSPELRSRFEHKYGGDSTTYVPPFTDLLKFLEDECRLADNSTPAVAQGGQPRDRPSQPFRKRSPRYAPMIRNSVRCMYCNCEGHRVTSCQNFLALSVDDRRRCAHRSQWCYACLGDHYQRSCTARIGPCKFCSGAHHPILCANRTGSRSPQPPEPAFGHMNVGPRSQGSGQRGSRRTKRPLRNRRSRGQGTSPQEERITSPASEGHVNPPQQRYYPRTYVRQVPHSAGTGGGNESHPRANCNERTIVMATRATNRDRVAASCDELLKRPRLNSGSGRFDRRNDGSYEPPARRDKARQSYADFDPLAHSLVCVRGPKRHLIVRALLDSGAQGCLVSKWLVQELGLPMEPYSEGIRGVGDAMIGHPIGQVKINFTSLQQYGTALRSVAIVLNRVVGDLPQIALPPEVTGQLLIGNKKVLVPGGLVALPTSLGSVVMGPIVGRSDSF
ncbi:hypothetical protein Cfor_06215, partial [Coptotermes formosanus]